MGTYTEVGTAASSAPSRQVWAAGIASILGWSFDLFDLLIILFIAPTIGPLFFPVQSPTLMLASVYASFGVTLLMRPIGSAFFGSYADRKGRKSAMVLAVFGVGIFTALLGALPTFPKVGIVAPIIFVIVRLIQGIFVGGVIASTHTLGTETVAPKWRGLFSGLITSGAGFGALLASVAFAVVSWIFPGPAFAEWGWRVMFFCGLFSSALGFFAFRAVSESPLWNESRQRGITKAPVRAVFTGPNLPIILVNLIITIGLGSAYYLTSGFLPTFLVRINNLPRPVAAEMLIVASVVTIIVSPLIGQASEIIGRKAAFIIIGVLGVVGLPLLYVWLTKLNPADTGAIMLATVLITVLGFIGSSVAPVYLNERFPTAIRSTGTGLSWNIGYAVGGMMPTFVTAASSSIASIPTVLEIFLIVINILFLVGAIITPETKGKFE
jgi:MHS family proline/betaine transporter-like MFS transporter